MKRYVILHNIRSAHNVGSIFRTADGAGVEKIYLTGYTPTPIDRFGRVHPEILKTSLGATESVSWEAISDVGHCIDTLHFCGIEVCAVEQHPDSIEYTQHQAEADVAYLFGNEVEGVPLEVLDRADTIIEIPMRGVKESLNVSVAAGIVLFSSVPQKKL